VQGVARTGTQAADEQGVGILADQVMKFGVLANFVFHVARADLVCLAGNGDHGLTGHRWGAQAGGGP
jgi:hypothetical protein